jgi:hypothetical protein
LKAAGAERPAAFLQRMLSSDRSFWMLAAVLLGEVALLKGIRYPNEWAATQALMDYSHGFIKRGLFGTVLARPLGLERFGRFAAVSELLLVALLVALFVLAVHSGLARRMGTALPVAVFFASYSVTFLGHIVGYFDIPLAIMTVALLAIDDDRWRAAAAVPLCVVAPLTHEMFLVVFLPVVLLSFVLRAMAEDAQQKRLWLIAGGLALLCVTVTVIIAARPSLTPGAAMEMQAQMIARANFRPAAAFFDVFSLSVMDNFRIMRFRHFNDPAWWYDQRVSVAVFLPTLVSLGWCAYWMLRKSAVRAWKAALALTLLAGMAPVLMHLVGWDTGRWNALAGLEMFLALVVVSRFTEGPETEMPLMARNLMVLVIALSMASGGLLMDHVQTRLFPFF